MKLFVSGRADQWKPRTPEKNVCGVVRRVLHAYPGIRRKREPFIDRDVIEMWDTYKTDMFLDSGAFSAYMSGVQITVDEYVRFCKLYGHMFSVIAALDVIKDEQATWTNYLAMRKAGVNCIPTFHFPEPYSALERMIGECEYIGIGGVAQLGVGEKLFDWLDHIWAKYLTDKDGRPKVKIHGFAVTSRKAIKRYPWESVDSTSWGIGMYGKIAVELNDRIWQISFSRAYEDLINGNHYKNLSRPMQKAIDEFLAKYGYTAEQAAEPLVRDLVNLKYFEELEEEVAKTFRNEQKGLFV